MLYALFRIKGAQVKEFCQFGTIEECQKVNGTSRPCGKLHFKKIIHKHTDGECILSPSWSVWSANLNMSLFLVNLYLESLGDCSFLNTCFHMDTCKYVHYEIAYPEIVPKPQPNQQISKKTEGSTILYPPQASVTLLLCCMNYLMYIVWKDCLIDLFNIYSGFSVIYVTLTCPSWGSLPWSWLILHGIFTWSSPTAQCKTTRCVISAFQCFRMMDTSFYGWQEGEPSLHQLIKVAVYWWWCLFQGLWSLVESAYRYGGEAMFLLICAHALWPIDLMCLGLRVHVRYERVDELIWVKANQLQRIIRTGRTGHWLNHGKEHCLVSGCRLNLFFQLSRVY